MAWRQPGDKPLSEPKMISLLTHKCFARLHWGINEVSIHMSAANYIKIHIFSYIAQHVIKWRKYGCSFNTCFLSVKCRVSWSLWRHQMETYPRYCPFVRWIHRSLVNFPHKGQWRGALMFSLICAWTNGWINNRDAGDLKRHRDHYDVTVMMEVFIDLCSAE